MTFYITAYLPSTLTALPHTPSSSGATRTRDLPWLVRSDDVGPWSFALRASFSSIPKSLVLSWNKMSGTTCHGGKWHGLTLKRTPSHPGGYPEEERGLGLFFNMAPYGLSFLLSLSVSPSASPLTVFWGVALSEADPLDSTPNWNQTLVWILCPWLSISQMASYSWERCCHNPENNQEFPSALSRNLSGLLPESYSVLCCWDGFHCFSIFCQHTHSVLCFHLKLHIFPGE